MVHTFITFFETILARKMMFLDFNYFSLNVSMILDHSFISHDLINFRLAKLILFILLVLAT